jgi:hypothetical protein
MRLRADSSHSPRWRTTAKIGPKRQWSPRAMHDLPLRKLSDGAILMASLGDPAKPVKEAAQAERNAGRMMRCGASYGLSPWRPYQR